KEIDPSASRTSSTVHGKNGVGRLTFFTFSSLAKWEIVYEKKGKKYKYIITVDALNLDNYVASDPVETLEPTGTTVYFQDIHTIIADNFNTNIKEFLCREFGWFLELNLAKKFSIKINDTEIDYRGTLIAEQEITQYKSEEHIFEIKFIRWLKSLNREYSRYFLISSAGDEKYTDTTTLNNKGDGFFHSVFIKSSFFNSGNVILYETSLYKHTKEGEAYKKLMDSVNRLLREKRKPFLKKVSDEILENFEKSGAFPKFKNNTWDQYRKSELETFIKELYQVEPKIFTSLNIEQKKVFVHFLNLIIDSGERDKLIEVLGEIVTLESSELEHLAESLKVSKLSNIIRTVRLIEDRYKAIDQLKNLVFKPELRANERDHVQKFVENHYWIFGEQYHLVTSTEPKFEEALRRYVYHLRGEKPVISIDHPDKNKEMDIFMVRQLLNDSSISNVVVELKHPNVKLGSKELEQVKKYMGVILEQDEFNAPNMSWEFYLVGNDFSQTGYIDREIKNSKYHGERSLVYSVDNHKIYVKKWSEIFTEFELRHKFLYEKLELERSKLATNEQSADAVISEIQNNSAIQPSQLVVPND
ncbi:MAG: ATP-binding protein, partial [Phormidesmis sp. CAN_BIN44]|nr:ATP-binding protein [Phormidesmis sp. CAN_BIN44]